MRYNATKEMTCRQIRQVDHLCGCDVRPPQSRPSLPQPVHSRLRYRSPVGCAGEGTFSEVFLASRLSEASGSGESRRNPRQSGPLYWRIVHI